MDDLILRSATWQAEHFFDHRLLGPDGGNPVSQPEMGTSKVVVLSFDRNRTFLFPFAILSNRLSPFFGNDYLRVSFSSIHIFLVRLKARSRKLDAADEKDMGGILAATTV